MNACVEFLEPAFTNFGRTHAAQYTHIVVDKHVDNP